MTSIDVSGRVRIIEGCPPALPGKCAICGACEGRTFIDIGFDLDYYGVVYFCSTCLAEVAGALDYHPPRQWKMLMRQIEDQREEINNLKDQNDALRIDMDALARVSGLTHANRVPDSTVDEVHEKSNPEPESDPEQFNISSPERETRSPQPIDESRRSDVQYDDSLDDFIETL